MNRKVAIGLFLMAAACVAWLIANVVVQSLWGGSSWTALRAVGFLAAGYALWPDPVRRWKLLGSGLIVAGATDIISFLPAVLKLDPVGGTFEAIEGVGGAILIVVGVRALRDHQPSDLPMMRWGIALIAVTGVYWLAWNFKGVFAQWAPGNVLTIFGAALVFWGFASRAPAERAAPQPSA